MKCSELPEVGDIYFRSLQIVLKVSQMKLAWPIITLKTKLRSYKSVHNFQRYEQDQHRCDGGRYHLQTGGSRGLKMLNPIFSQWTQDHPKTTIKSILASKSYGSCFSYMYITCFIHVFIHVFHKFFIHVSCIQSCTLDIIYLYWIYIPITKPDQWSCLTIYFLELRQS